MATLEGRLAVGWIVLNLVALLVMVAIGQRRWRAAGLDLDGRDPVG
jgi:hypothetical protein